MAFLNNNSDQSSNVGLLAAALLAASTSSGCGSSEDSVNDVVAGSIVVSTSLVQPIPANHGKGQVLVVDYDNPVVAFTSNTNVDYSYVTARYRLQGKLWESLSAQLGVAAAPFSSTARQTAPPHDALAARKTIDMLEEGLLQVATAPMAVPQLAPRTFASASLAANVVGTNQEFWVIAGSTFKTITATCQAIGTNLYVYVDDTVLAAFPGNSAVLSDLVNVWDNQIYPRVREQFGSEWTPGIDSDPKITILISPAVHDYENNNGVLGYFWAGDEFTQEELAGTSYQTNEREMLYVTDELGNLPSTMVYGILAHEFQHMVNFHNRYILNGTNEDIWLNEGMSMLAMQLAGYGMPDGDPTTTGWVDFYLRNPSFYALGDQLLPNSLVLWNGAGYGQSYLFLLYLYEQYGGRDLIARLMSSPYKGIRNVENATSKPFAVVYHEWLATLYLDGRAAEPKYNFSSVDLQGTYTGALADDTYGAVALPGLQTINVETLPSDYTGRSLPPWTAEFVEFHGATTPVSLNLRLDDVDSSLGTHLINLHYR